MGELIKSCGTLSSSCTASTERESPPRSADLLRELDLLRTLLIAQMAKTSEVYQGEQPLLVLAGLVPDLTPEMWKRIKEQDWRALASWFALELDPVEHPQMLGLCRADAPNYGPICPLTGTLLPSPFLSELTTALDKVQTDGGDMTLILFAVDDSEFSPENAKSDSPERDNLTEYVIDYDKVDFPVTDKDTSLCLLARLFRQYARKCDIPGRLSKDRLALLMPGIGPFRARAMTERLIGAFQEEAYPAGLLLRAGLVCCDSETIVPAKQMIDQATSALALAKPGFSRTYREVGVPEPERKTQVQACEKAFLFFGDAEQL